jgi:hypothetical protein
MKLSGGGGHLLEPDGTRHAVRSLRPLIQQGFAYYNSAYTAAITPAGLVWLAEHPL